MNIILKWPKFGLWGVWGVTMLVNFLLHQPNVLNLISQNPENPDAGKAETGECPHLAESVSSRFSETLSQNIPWRAIEGDTWC
jgi:hypothetical protein